MAIKHMIIPDTQCKPNADFQHLSFAGQYAVDKKPDVIVFIGDHWDMPSLSSYDVGKKSFEGRRYIDDIQAGQLAMATFLAPLELHNIRAREQKKKLYLPRLVFCLGNHEERINKAVESDRKLEGLISTDDLELDVFGFEVVPFLQPIVIDGVCYSHYFSSGILGRPVSSARALLTKKHMSCVMGHVQDRAIDYQKRADGKNITGIFAGIFYPHKETYLTPQTDKSWAGIWMLHDVKDGEFDEMPVSLSYLRRRYGSL